jgi:hypothetical protein
LKFQENQNRLVYLKTGWFLTKPNGFHFDEFCRPRWFNFLNSVLTKNLEVDSSFFRIFYLFFQIFENFKFDRLIFQKPEKPVSTGFSSFCENRLVFERFFNPCAGRGFMGNLGK